MPDPSQLTLSQFFLIVRPGPGPKPGLRPERACPR